MIKLNYKNRTIKMVSIVPVNFEVDNVILAGARIEDEPNESEENLPVAVPIVVDHFLIGEKLPVCFDTIVKCYELKQKADYACSLCLIAAPITIYCGGVLGGSIYLLYCTHCICFP
jgi:hypothetical protein